MVFQKSGSYVELRSCTIHFRRENDHLRWGIGGESVGNIFFAVSAFPAPNSGSAPMFGVALVMFGGSIPVWWPPNVTELRLYHVWWGICWLYYVWWEFHSSSHVWWAIPPKGTELTLSEFCCASQLAPITFGGYFF